MTEKGRCSLQAPVVKCREDGRKRETLSLKAPLRLVTSLIAGAALVLLVLWVDPAAILAALSHVSALHVVAGLALVQAQIILSALRWRFTAARLGQPMSRGAAIGEYYVASAVNQLVPGGMAGDVLRAWRVAEMDAGGFRRAARAVVYERLSGQIAFLALCLAGLPLWPLLPAHGLAVESHLLLAAGLAVALALAAALLLRRFAGLRAELARVFLQGGAGLVQGGLSLVVVGAYVALFLLCADAVGAPLPPEGALTIVPLTLAAMLIPTGLGGWGTREAAAAALWPLAGLASAEGISASLLYGALALAGALPGLVVLAVNRQRRSLTHGARRRMSAATSTPKE
ncbi:flippase-like domain-containing protein [Rhizobium sp. CSW-27]|nr:flippase-like domain-containing protein [Rhizobium sp. CSW-27]